MDNYAIGILIVFICVFVVLIAVRRSRNTDNVPIESVFGKIIAKRTEIKSYNSNDVRTLYHVTIEFEDRNRKNLKLKASYKVKNF